MRGQHPGGRRPAIDRAGIGPRQRTAEHALDLGARNSSWTQQCRGRETADDGGFDADLHCSSINDQVDPPRKIALHMRRCRRGNMAGQVGRGRHHRAAEFVQDVAGHRMGGNADCNGVEAGRGKFGHRAVRSLRQHQRQRARPERVSERKRRGIETGDPVRGFEIADMHDQRIEGGPALGAVEPRDRFRIGGVGAEPVDCLGGERDQAAVAERPGSCCRRGRAGRSNLRCQFHGHWNFSFRSSFLRCAKPKAISRVLSECGSAR